jgi:hypothetical protein
MAPRKKSDRKETLPTSVRITPTCQQLWDDLAEHMGLSKAGVLETLIRDRAKAEGLQVRAEDTAEAAA